MEEAAVLSLCTILRTFVSGDARVTGRAFMLSLSHQLSFRRCSHVSKEIRPFAGTKGGARFRPAPPSLPRTHPNGPFGMGQQIARCVDIPRYILYT